MSTPITPVASWLQSGTSYVLHWHWQHNGSRWLLARGPHPDGGYSSYGCRCDATITHAMKAENGRYVPDAPIITHRAW